MPAYKCVIAITTLAVTIVFGVGEISKVCEARTARTMQQELSLRLETSRSSFRLADPVTLRLILTNVSRSPVFIYKLHNLSDSAGLLFWTRDVKTGKSLNKRFIPEALPPPNPSTELFEEIAPGASVILPMTFGMSDLDIAIPGNYEISAAYSPVFQIEHGRPSIGTTIRTNRAKLNVSN